MKKHIMALALAAICAVSCYEDYVGDYSKIACGFANQTDVRSVIAGEGMSFSTGVALGGTINNDKDRKIGIGPDYSLVNESTLEALRGHTFSYISSLMGRMVSIEALSWSVYELETESGNPGQALIRKGTHLGRIKVKIDSAWFFADPQLLDSVLKVIPLMITDGNGTDIIEGREYSVIGVRYENTLFGNWYHGGAAVIKDGTGASAGTMTYPASKPQADNLVWTLTTVDPNSVTANAVVNAFNGEKAQMKLRLNADGSITISSVAGASYDVQPDGESRLIRSKLLQDRKIVLSYKYADGGHTVHARDTLTFRNRIRDGVNEWQDENSSHYE